MVGFAGRQVAVCLEVGAVGQIGVVIVAQVLALVNPGFHGDRGRNWQIHVKDGKERYLVTLHLGPSGSGQLYIFCPTDEANTKGKLTVAGLVFKVEKRLMGNVVVLENCALLPDKMATMAFTAEKGKLQLRGGKALRSKEDSAGLDLKGEWTSLNTPTPYGNIEVAPGGGMEYSRISITK